MIVNQLLLSGLVHTFERIEFALQITLKGFTSLDDQVHDLEALFFCDAWTEWEAGEVSPNTNACRINHGGILGREFSILNAFRGHVRNMLVRRLVAVILFDDWVKELAEFGVGVVRPGVNTDARIKVSNSGENTSLERNSSRIRLVLVLFPDFLRHALREKGLGSCGKECFIMLELIGRVERHWLKLLLHWWLLGHRLGMHLLHWRLHVLLLLHAGRSHAFSASCLDD